jgi:prephenate dehydrogenase
VQAAPEGAVRIVKLALETVRRGRFLGGHPMAGKEARGVAAAVASLFEGRTYFLTPRDFADLDAGRGLEFTQWIRRIGALPTPISAADHDRVVAAASHLPQLASTALAAAVAQLLDPGDARRAAGPGLHDMTRLALSSHELWADILATNGAEIDRALAAFAAQIERLRSRLGSGAVEEDFSAAADLARRLRQSR